MSLAWLGSRVALFGGVWLLVDLISFCNETIFVKKNEILFKQAYTAVCTKILHVTK